MEFENLRKSAEERRGKIPIDSYSITPEFDDKDMKPVLEFVKNHNVKDKLRKAAKELGMSLQVDAVPRPGMLQYRFYWSGERGYDIITPTHFDITITSSTISKDGIFLSIVRGEPGQHYQIYHSHQIPNDIINDEEKLSEELITAYLNPCPARYRQHYSD